MFIKIGPKFQSLEGDHNFNVYKNRARIPMIARNSRIPVFKGIRQECQYFEGQDQNSNVYKSRARISMLGRIRPQFQCL